MTLKVNIAEILQGLTDPGTKFSSSPERVAAMAQFLYKTGVVKTKMESFKDFFFPEIHAAGGS